MSNFKRPTEFPNVSVASCKYFYLIKNILKQSLFNLLQASLTQATATVARIILKVIYESCVLVHLPLHEMQFFSYFLHFQHYLRDCKAICNN